MGNLVWGPMVTGEQADILRDFVAESAVGGDSEDWRMSAHLYDLDDNVTVDGVTVYAGTYIRVVDDNGVRAYSVTGDAYGYIDAVEAEFEADQDAYDY